MVAVDILLDALGFVRLVPHLVPVLVDLGGSSCSNCVENVLREDGKEVSLRDLCEQTRRALTLSRVVGIGTPLVSASMEVLDKGRRVFAKISKVDGLSSLLEEEETIEGLEELRRGLMDGGKDGLCMGKGRISAVEPQGIDQICLRP